MKPSTFLSLACALLIAEGSASPVGAASKSRSPNVVLFLVDDMGWLDSTPYGSRYYETPNMERLAAQSMRFTDAYAVPLCSPTRATLLSGQYSARHGVTSASGHQPPQAEDDPLYPEKASPNSRFIYPESRNYLDPKLTTLAETLQKAGYRTGHFGKWHLGSTPPHWPDKQGFEEAWFCTPDPGPPSYFSPYGVHTEGRPTGQHHVGTITDGPEGEYITDRLTDEAIRFIDSHRGEPFFLNLWQYGVHGPWGHKEEYTRQFAMKKDPRGFQANPIMASMLRSVDDSLGRILDRLDELDLTRDTLFIFFSDNGGNTHSNTPDSRQMVNIKPGHPKYAFVQDWKKWAGDQPPTNNEPLREGKGRIYEGGQRVPLMVRWPGHVKPGTVSDAVVGAVDFYPTILEALGVPAPRSQILDGESFLPILEQRGSLKRQAYFTWFPHLIPAVSVRSGDYKLIRRWEPHADYPDLLELYHLKDDLGETRNLASQQPDRVREMESLIEAFIRDTGARVPKPNPDYKPRPTQPNRAAATGTTDGLVPKGCELNMEAGFARMTGTARNPFLGTAQIKASGPLSLQLRLRSTAGGTGRVQWMLEGQEALPASGQQVEFKIPAGADWQDLQVAVPIPGDVTTRILRLYLPASEAPVDLARIRWTPTKGRARSWQFSTAE